MKNIFDNAVAQQRFSMTEVFNAVLSDTSRNTQKTYKNLQQRIGNKVAKKVFQSVLRFSFFIEPVKKPKIESTKYAVRWNTELLNDLRYAPYDECLKIFKQLLGSLLQASMIEDNRSLLQMFAENSMIAYEMPIDYKERRLKSAIHTHDNIMLFWEDSPRKTLNLRKFLLKSDNHTLSNFFTNAYNKIIVKSNLTDRVLTGEYKTNREKRWEVHPASVHFSFRRDSLEIERKLINQLCYFDQFPTLIQLELEKQQLITFDFIEDSSSINNTEKISRCPITLEPLSFPDFKKELLWPQHGKATYQVGHMHPLKATSDNPNTGHTAKNISWISSQGNRIQGELSVEETRDLILRIIHNYRQAGFID